MISEQPTKSGPVRFYRPRRVANLAVALFAAALLLLPLAACHDQFPVAPPSTDTVVVRDTVHSRDTLTIRDTTFHVDSAGYFGPRVGTLYGYSEYLAGTNGQLSYATGWLEGVDLDQMTAFGERNTYHLSYPPSLGFGQQRKVDSNGDLEMWAAIIPTGGAPVGTSSVAGTPLLLNQWLRWPMSAAPGRYCVLRQDLALANDTLKFSSIIYVQILGHTVLQTMAGPVNTVEFIETDTSASFRIDGGGLYSGSVYQYHQWYAPSLGCFIKSESFYPDGTENKIEELDTLTNLEYH